MGVTLDDFSFRTLYMVLFDFIIYLVYVWFLESGGEIFILPP